MAILVVLYTASPSRRGGEGSPASAERALAGVEAIEAEALRALGYVDEATDVPDGAPVGVLSYKLIGGSPGPILLHRIRESSPELRLIPR